MRTWYRSLDGESRLLVHRAALHGGLALIGWIVAWDIGRKANG